jgi:hypothetical protein
MPRLREPARAVFSLHEKSVDPNDRVRVPGERLAGQATAQELLPGPHRSRLAGSAPSL